jgi:hypothetical protein
MAILIQALTTGVGVNTGTGAQAQCESDILIGDVDTANPLQGLKCVIDSVTTIDIQLAVFVNFFMKFTRRMVGSGVIGLLARVATGRIMKNCVITFTNAGATTPIVYSNSERSNGVPVYAIQDSLNLSSNKNITGFAGLAVTPIANIGSFDVTFSDGTVQSLTVIEADALFSKDNDTQTDGRLDAACTGFDNRDGSIASVKINSNSTGAVQYMVIK